MNGDNGTLPYTNGEWTWGFKMADICEGGGWDRGDSGTRVERGDFSDGERSGDAPLWAWEDTTVYLPGEVSPSSVPFLYGSVIISLLVCVNAFQSTSWSKNDIVN